MSVTERLDRMQRQHPVLGFPLAVLYKFVDDQGGYLCCADHLLRLSVAVPAAAADDQRARVRPGRAMRICSSGC